MSQAASNVSSSMTTTVIISGPSGVGKSTVGEALAKALGARFVEGDEYHPAANVAKMRSGTPLQDADRLPWLDRLHEEVVLRRGPELQPPAPLVVLACSALKRSYRDQLRGSTRAGDKPEGSSGRVFFLFLDGDREVLKRRLEARAGHFMPPSLLASQLETLEPLDPDEDGGVLDFTYTREQILQEAKDAVNYFCKRLTPSVL